MDRKTDMGEKKKKDSNIVLLFLKWENLFDLIKSKSLGDLSKISVSGSSNLKTT